MDIITLMPCFDKAISTLQAFEHLPAKALYYALFQAAYVALGYAHHVGNFFLGIFFAGGQAKTHEYDFLFPAVKSFDGLHEHFLICIVFQRTGNLVVIGAEYVGEEKLVTFPICVQRLIKAYFAAMGADFSQIHQYLIFYAAGCVCGKLYVFAGIKGVDGFNKPYGAN